MKMEDLKVNDTSISLRINSELVDEFKHFAKEDGIGYQTLMKMALANYLYERDISKYSKQDLKDIEKLVDKFKKDLVKKLK